MGLRLLRRPGNNPGMNPSCRPGNKPMRRIWNGLSLSPSARSRQQTLAPSLRVLRGTEQGDGGRQASPSSCGVSSPSAPFLLSSVLIFLRRRRNGPPRGRRGTVEGDGGVHLVHLDPRPERQRPCPRAPAAPAGFIDAQSGPPPAPRPRGAPVSVASSRPCSDRPRRLSARATDG